LITEHGILQLKPGQSADFEAAMAEALPLIAATPGFLDIDILPCLESPDRYLLLVRWDSVEAHEKGFRGSDRYAPWKALLHRYYEPFPTIEHYGPSIVSLV